MDFSGLFVVAMFAVGMGAAFFVADPQSPTSRALAISLTLLGIDIATHGADRLGLFGDHTSIWPIVSSICEAGALIAAYEWILRVGRTRVQADCRTRRGEAAPCIPVAGPGLRGPRHHAARAPPAEARARMAPRRLRRALLLSLRRAVLSVARVRRRARGAAAALGVRRTHAVFAPEDAANGLPATDDPVAQLFFLGESPSFERFVDRAYGHSVVFGYLDREDSQLTGRVIGRLETYLAAHPPRSIRVSLAGGVGPTLLAINEDTVKGKISNIAIVLAVIFAIASVLLRTPLGGAYVAAPLVMALVVNLGLFSALGIAFDLGDASIAAIGVGIGADYVIYFLYRLFSLSAARRIPPERRHRRSPDPHDGDLGRAVLFVALAISAGFGIYAASDFHSLHIVGFFVPLTMLVSCLTALTLLPALVLLLRPTFIFDPARVAAEPAESLLKAASSR